MGLSNKDDHLPVVLCDTRKIFVAFMCTVEDTFLPFRMQSSSLNSITIKILSQIACAPRHLDCVWTQSKENNTI